MIQKTLTGIFCIQIMKHFSISLSTVSWQAFSKDTLKKPDRTFTFWEWLYSCIDLIKKHFLPMWKDNLIEVNFLGL